MDKGDSKIRREEVNQVTKGEGSLSLNGGQSMPQGKDWCAFLSSGENKTELIPFLVEYYKSQAVRCIYHRSCSYIPLCNII